MIIMVVGGTGGFGSTICGLLQRDGHVVVAAGRDEARGRAFAERMPGVGFRAVDRDRIGDADLDGFDLVVDAAGPFRDQDRSLARACIAAGVHHLDIADDRAFVTGARELDDAAKRAGVVVLSGASSVPALSTAVAVRTSAGMDEVHLVETAISASSKAAFGRSVLHSMLSGAGREVRRGDGTRGVAMTDPRRIRLGGPGGPTRTVMEVDAPDQDLLADMLPGRPSVRFRAGGELAVHNLAMRLIAHAVRSGALSGGTALLPLASAARRLTAWMGSGRSGMEVAVTGDVAGRRVRRTWRLMAGRNRGPVIPCLAVPALVRRIACGSIPAGAGPAVGILDVDEILSGLDPAEFSTTLVETGAAPVHAGMFGWSSLAPAIRDMHDVPRHASASGRASVERGRGATARATAWVFGFPDAGDDVPVRVAFEPVPGGERWTRDFGGRRFSSVITPAGTGLRERFGQFSFRFRLEERAGSLAMVPRSWRLFGVRLPRRLMPDGVATETEVDGTFRFDVPIRAPLIGTIVHYRGWLRPDGRR
jgi:hypothetical protein